MVCRFARSGFPFPDGRRARPCGSSYHPKCFRVGEPFQTRLRDEKGLMLPALSDFPGFICEACTVRAVLQRNLRSHGADWSLLALERMRLLDVLNSWSEGTHQQYQGKLRVIRQFEAQFDVPILRLAPLAAPPVSPAIPLGWCQQKYSLRSSNRSHSGKDQARVTFGSTRAIRSAASQFFKLELMAKFPEAVLQDRASRTVAVRQTLPTDELSCTLMHSGMASRLGEDSIPAEALLDRHVRYLDRHLQELFDRSDGVTNQLAIARAGFTNLNLWLTWCRGQEHFGLRFCDITMILPEASLSHGLPPGTGCLLERLKPDTKSSRTTQADVVAAYRTGSGLCLGEWYSRILRLEGLTWEAAAADTRPICRQPDGTPWTSQFFRSTYLWPSLTQQRLEGEPTLQRFDDSPGLSIPERFYSMHCWRRGGNSHVTKKRRFCKRRATDREIDEHGRWEKPRDKQEMKVAYRQWTLADRHAITYECM